MTTSPDHPPRSLTAWLVSQALVASLLVSGAMGAVVAAGSLIGHEGAGGDGPDPLSVWFDVALGTLAANLLLSALLAVMLHRAVTRPLAGMEAVLRAAGSAEGEAGAVPGIPPESGLAISVPPALNGTEIGRLVGTFASRMDGLARSHAQLSVMVRQDHLTGLPNRICMGEQLTDAVARARVSDTQVALLFLDLDRFKHINDSLGHAAGDKLLQLVAVRLRDLCPGVNSIARMGGDEFLILLESVNDRAKVIRVAEDVLFELSRPFQISGHAVHFGTSIGISIWPRDGSDSEQLMRSADTAMYAAKSAGAGTWRFFSREMREQSLIWLRTEASLREALEQDQLEVFYQPKVMPASGKLYGMEALLRWRQGDELISPSEFIQIAEDTGLIIPIGAWVLRTACRQAMLWSRSHGRLQIAVNVSARQLRTLEFGETVRQVLEETGLPAAQLTLEITESMLMGDIEESLEALRVLRAIGVGIAVDDFGTGYSSLAYLRQLPITQLKIDRSFIKDVPNDTAISETIMTLATKLNLQCVAEGVETAQQYGWLATSGCHLVQGYYIARPLPARAFELEFLKESTLRLVVNADAPGTRSSGE